MRKFLIKCVLFFLPVAVAAYSLDYIVTQGLRKTDQEPFAEWNELFDGKINADIVINGSSRAVAHISPKILEEKTGCSAYNLGMNGQAFYVQYYRYLAYRKYNKTPKIIIQSLDFNSLEKNPALGSYEQFLPYLNEKIIADAAVSYKELNVFDTFVPFYRYMSERNLIRIGFQEFFNIKHYTNNKYKGYEGQNLPWNGDNLQRLKKHGEKERTVKLDSETVKLFESYIKDTKASGIELVLVYTPFYIEGQSIYVNHDEILLTYKNLAEKYNVLFLDYSKDPMSFRRDLFYNAEHLNIRGSEILSDDLVSAMLKNKIQGCGFN